MSIKITCKDLKLTDSIKEYIEKKSERIEKYFDEEIELFVTIKSEKGEEIAEMSILAFRAVTAHRDLYAAIDKDIDILEGQIRKSKTQKERQNKDGSLKGLEVADIGAKQTSIENEIIKTLYYEIKPMTPEDAKLKLQEKPNNMFLAFINVETNKVNVIYRIKDGKNYGLVEPE
ncbi:MAG: ribosome-associated translation inhibitor RaiA [Lachnospiraceae bacterium]|nr:ribosome-associated translation inhibitor RaiA [Lachnospiraceae bacterium]